MRSESACRSRDAYGSHGCKSEEKCTHGAPRGKFNRQDQIKVHGDFDRGKIITVIRPITGATMPPGGSDVQDFFAEQSLTGDLGVSVSFEIDCGG